ncbi:hypothetical protein B0H21DRAFT_826820 [Amylocystis lapponica]|nr:hypothetical protein B0H21DRAFT_826820 [Amylocystis lapponica]
MSNLQYVFPPNMVPANAPPAPLPGSHAAAVAFFQQYREFVAEFQAANPNQPPPSLDQFQQFQLLDITRILNLPPMLPPPPVIQPDLEINAALATIQKDVAELKRARQEEENDADNESDEHPTKKRSRRAKTTKADRILTVKGKKLANDQIMVAAELKTRINQKLMDLTGLGPNPFPLRKAAADEDGDEPPAEDGPGANEGAGGDEVVPNRMEFDFVSTHGVRKPANARVIQRAVDLVFTDETNPDTRTITHPTVQFTKPDLAEFAKSKFRTWRKCYLNRVDEEKNAAAIVHQAKNKRHRRRQQAWLRKLRASQVEKYLKKYGVNPEPLLHTDWMSEQVSGWSDDEESQSARRKLLAERASLTPADIESGTKVLERRQLAWRSAALTLVYARLDELVIAYRKRSANPTIDKYKRINLGRPRLDAPDTKVYPFAISARWIRGHLEDVATIDTFKNNPAGFEDAHTELSSSGSEPEADES